MANLLKDLVSYFETLWPLDGAEEWDAPGLISGSLSSSVARVLLTVDVTQEVINEAINGQFDLVVAHHPLIMRGIKTMAANTAKGSILSQAILNNVSIYAAHTNADIVPTGVSARLAQVLGLKSSIPLIPKGQEAIGHGRVGQLESATTLGEFARLIAKRIPSTATGIRVSGDFEQEISTVALCAGAGDSLIQAAYDSHADVYVTSDLRHHVAQEIRETASASGREFALIDISHWAAEWLWLEQAAMQIHDRFTGLQVVVSEIRTDPWDFAVTQ